jgi:hypothetical protein
VCRTSFHPRLVIWVGRNPCETWQGSSNPKSINDAIAIPTRDHLGILQQPRVPPSPPQPWADLPKVLQVAGA